MHLLLLLLLLLLVLLVLLLLLRLQLCECVLVLRLPRQLLVLRADCGLVLQLLLLLVHVHGVLLVLLLLLDCHRVRRVLVLLRRRERVGLERRRSGHDEGRLWDGRGGRERQLRAIGPPWRRVLLRTGVLVWAVGVHVGGTDGQPARHTAVSVMTRRSDAYLLTT